MTLENKKELVRLLHLYMADIMRQDAVKLREALADEIKSDKVVVMV
jgi:hypothetical protein